VKAVFALLAAFPALACNCDRRQSVCDEVASPGTVFIGTVESSAPSFMSRWYPLPRPALNQLNAANERYLAGQTPANLSALKDAFRNLFPNLPDDDRQKLDNASTHAAVVSIFTSVLNHGQRVHLRVRTVFRSGEDDDADGNDDAETPETLDVWTPFGDCGVDFQPGETYLVYAGNDEESNLLETDSCTRTRRLTDAGEDLAYLFFYKDRKNPATRLEGFATLDPLYQVHQSTRRDPDRIDLPASGVIVELRSPSGIRYTTSSPLGRFVFDGLAPGDHQVTAYAAGFPESVTVLAGPKQFHIEPRACSTQTLLIPKDAPSAPPLHP
jgi:hypothetical protein